MRAIGTEAGQRSGRNSAATHLADSASHPVDPVERRRAERGAAELGVKILRPSLARYLVGRTVDVSRGGALVTVQTSRALTPGEDVAIGVSWGNDPVLRREGMVTATVMRAESPEQHAVGTRRGGTWTQRVALRFARVQPAADPVVDRARVELGGQRAVAPAA